MPVGAFTLVCNIVFAHYWLKEDLSKNDLWGTILICIGAVLVTVFGKHDDTSYTLKQLIDLYLRWDMLIYAVITVSFLLVLYVHYNRTNSTSSIYPYQFNNPNNGRFSMLRSAQRVLRKKGALSAEYKSILKTHPLSYAGLAGVFGAQSVMFAKSVTELIKETTQGNNQFDKPLTYVLLLAMVLTIAVQVMKLNLSSTFIH
jgi:hypothetical protein